MVIVELMNDYNKIRLHLLKELKNVRRFFDNMERGVKSRNEEHIVKAYYFLKTLVHHLDKGDLTPEAIELHQLICERINAEDACLKND